MTRIVTSLSVVLFMANSAVWAQEPVPTAPVQPEVSVPVESHPAVDSPQNPSQWMYERQMQNRQGSTTNIHRRWDVPEEGRYVREHTVTNPRGTMTQSWERVDGEEGYQYRRSQTWTNPDGTPLRLHQQSVSGSDPHNYSREHSITLPDGRTVNQTRVRSWDGTSGTMERSFTGPNGQTHQSQRSGMPDVRLEGHTSGMAGPVQGPTFAPTTAPPVSQPAGKVGWWQKLNPFRKQRSESRHSAAISAPRRGFTIGTPRGNSVSASAFRVAESPSVHASQNTHRPSWAGGAPRSMSRQGPPSHANGNSAASRPKPGRGPNR